MNDIAIYEDGNIVLQANVSNESIWLKQDEIAQLFGKDRTVITRHINKILKDEEVNEKSNVQKIYFAHSDKPAAQRDCHEAGHEYAGGGVSIMRGQNLVEVRG